MLPSDNMATVSEDRICPTFLANTSVWQAFVGSSTLFYFISGIQRTVGTQDNPRAQKTVPEMEALQHKVSEVLGVGNNLKA